ncbi:hypothetical protein OROGR_018046 [Orobanche gracilis]
MMAFSAEAKLAELKAKLVVLKAAEAAAEAELKAVEAAAEAELKAVESAAETELKAVEAELKAEDPEVEAAAEAELKDSELEAEKAAAEAKKAAAAKETKAAVERQKAAAEAMKAGFHCDSCFSVSFDRILEYHRKRLNNPSLTAMELYQIFRSSKRDLKVSPVQKLIEYYETLPVNQITKDRLECLRKMELNNRKRKRDADADTNADTD